MRERAELLNHVVDPDEIGVLRLFVLFVFVGSVVAVEQSVDVGADEFATVAYVVEPVAVDPRG